MIQTDILFNKIKVFRSEGEQSEGWHCKCLCNNFAHECWKRKRFSCIRWISLVSFTSFLWFSTCNTDVIRVWKKKANVLFVDVSPVIQEGFLVLNQKSSRYLNPSGGSFRSCTLAHSWLRESSHDQDVKKDVGHYSHRGLRMKPLWELNPPYHVTYWDHLKESVSWCWSAWEGISRLHCRWL